SGALKSDKWACKIADIEPLTFFDLICKLVDRRETPGQTILTVWDGTKSKCDFAVEGDPLSTALTLAVEESTVREKIKNVPLGTWVRFRNLSASVRGEELVAIAAYKSSFVIIDEQDPRVVELINAYSTRQQNFSSGSPASTTMS